MYIQKKNRVVADDEILDEEVTVEDIPADVEVDPAATELLFETDDVAELIAEVTGEDVEVSIDDEETGNVTFGVGDEEYEVSPEEGAEILEAVRMPRKRSVKASANRSTRKDIKSSKDAKKKVVSPRTKVRVSSNK